MDCFQLLHIIQYNKFKGRRKKALCDASPSFNWIICWKNRTNMLRKMTGTERERGGERQISKQQRSGYGETFATWEMPCFRNALFIRWRGDDRKKKFYKCFTINQRLYKWDTANIGITDNMWIKSEWEKDDELSDTKVFQEQCPRVVLKMWFERLVGDQRWKERQMTEQPKEKSREREETEVVTVSFLWHLKEAKSFWCNERNSNAMRSIQQMWYIWLFIS